ncbi:MAG: cation:proton antiporter [Candidatus Zixiibacteriota bacterium]
MENITRILFDLFLMFAVAKLMGELFERARQPAVVGEILAGIILGPYILNMIGPSHFYTVLAEIGVIILLFNVGLHTRTEDMLRVGPTSLVVAILGIIFPFIFGFLFTQIIAYSTVEAMFIGAAMVATSVGITARVLADLGILEAKVSKVIIGAAVIDDIIGLIVLAVVAGLGKGTISYVTIGLVLLEAVAFVIFLIFIGRRVMYRFFGANLSFLKSRNAPFSLAILICLGLSAVASYIHLAAIVGAFMAGMILAEFNIQFRLSVKTESLYDFLVPFFFIMMGKQVDLSIFLHPSIIGAALILTVFAILGKLLGCGLGAISLGWKQASLVGVGMVPRGEVGLIIASLGLSLGAITQDLYSIVVFMVIATTLLTPPVLRSLVYKIPEIKEIEAESEDKGEETW